MFERIQFYYGSGPTPKETLIVYENVFVFYYFKKNVANTKILLENITKIIDVYVYSGIKIGANVQSPREIKTVYFEQLVKYDKSSTKKLFLFLKYSLSCNMSNLLCHFLK